MWSLIHMLFTAQERSMIQESCVVASPWKCPGRCWHLGQRLVTWIVAKSAKLKVFSLQALLCWSTCNMLSIYMNLPTGSHRPGLRPGKGIVTLWMIWTSSWHKSWPKKWENGSWLVHIGTSSRDIFVYLQSAAQVTLRGKLASDKKETMSTTLGSHWLQDSRRSKVVSQR